MSYEIPDRREGLQKYGDNFGNRSDYNIGNEVLGPLKRAMIDAFIAEKSFGGVFGHIQDRFAIDGAWYKLETGGDGDTGSTECWVKRPGPDGRGGGAHDPAHSAAGVPDYTGHFSDIRHWVNDQVSRWKELPDPAGFEELATAFGDVAAALKRDGGTLSGLVGDLNTKTSHDALAGSTISAFRNMFVIHTPTVLNGLSGIATLLVSYFQAQYGLWVAAQVGFVQIVEKYTQVFRDLSQHTSTRGDVVVRALQYAASAANAASLSGALNLAAETLQLTGLGSGEPSKSVSCSPDSFADGREKLREALNALNEDIYEAEKKIRDTAVENILHISSTGGYNAEGNYHQNNRENYDVLLAPEDIQAVADLRMVDFRIAMDGSLVDGIVNGPMEDIATKLHNLLLTTTGCHESIARCAKRGDSRIGVGTYGPGWVLQELNEVLCDLLQDLRSEVERGARQLSLACQVHMDHNAQVAADLAAVSQSLQDGSGYDPWDVKPPSVPLPGFSDGWIERMTTALHPAHIEEFETTSNSQIEEEPEGYEWKLAGR